MTATLTDETMNAMEDEAAELARRVDAYLEHGADDDDAHAAALADMEREALVAGYAAARRHLIAQAADLAHEAHQAARRRYARTSRHAVDGALTAWAWTWVDPYTPSTTSGNVVQRVLGDPRG